MNKLLIAALVTSGLILVIGTRAQLEPQTPPTPDIVPASFVTPVPPPENVLVEPDEFAAYVPYTFSDSKSVEAGGYTGYVVPYSFFDGTTTVRCAVLLGHETGGITCDW